MKLYLAVSGTLFALVGVAHVARVILEGTSPLGQPIFIASTAAAVGLSAWAAFLFLQRPPGHD